MKITIYTITDCQFSKAEKNYLKANNLPYEEKNLETNKEFLTEMLAVSNNFAGTPVTRVEKDDGTIRVFKGFTKEEFDEFFGFNQPQQPTQSQPTNPQLNNILNQLEQKAQPSQTYQPPFNSPNQDAQAPTNPQSPTDQISANANPSDVQLTPQEQAPTQQPNPLEEILQPDTTNPMPQNPTVGLNQLTTDNQVNPQGSQPPSNIPTIPDFPKGNTQ